MMNHGIFDGYGGSHAAAGAGDRGAGPCYSRGSFKLVRR